MNILKLSEYIKEEYEPLEIENVLKIKPSGQAGKMKGEEEMIKRGYEYIKEIRNKFRYTKKIIFNQLKLMDLSKKHGVGQNFSRFINRHELNLENGRMYSLKFPDKDPTIEDIRNIYREFRRYDTDISINYIKRRGPEFEKEKRKKQYARKNERRNELNVLNKFLTLNEDDFEKFLNKLNKFRKRKEERFLEGIDKEFASKLKASRKDVYGFCLGLNPNLADDIVQETFIIAYEQRYKYVPTAKFTTWLIGIAKKVYLRFIDTQNKRDKKEIMVSDFNDSDFNIIEEEHPLDIEEGNGKIKSIMDSFNDLNNQQKEVLNLVMKGYSYKEIKELLNMSSNKYVKTYVYNTRKHLAEKIHKRMPNFVIRGSSGIKK